MSIGLLTKGILNDGLGTGDTVYVPTFISDMGVDLDSLNFDISIGVEEVDSSLLVSLDVDAPLNMEDSGVGVEDSQIQVEV